MACKRLLQGILLVLVTISCCEAISLHVCNGEFVEPSDMELCPYGSSISIQSATLGVSSNLPTPDDACPVNDTEDCMVDLGDTVQPTVLDMLREDCDGKIVCERFLASPATISCGAFPVAPSYLIFEYDCITSADQLQYSVACQGTSLSEASCQTDYGLSIQQALYADTGTGGCEDHDTSAYRCVANITQADPDYHSQIQEACEGQQSCELDAKEFTVDDCGDAGTVTTNFVVLGYSCLPVLKTDDTCIDDTVDGVTCDAGFEINIVSAVFVEVMGPVTDDECANLGMANLTECELMPSVEDNKQFFWQDILNACNGKQACENLVASDYLVGQCFASEQSDWVRISYECLEVPMTPGSTMTTTSLPVDSTTSQASTSPSESTSESTVIETTPPTTTRPTTYPTSEPSSYPTSEPTTYPTTNPTSELTSRPTTPLTTISTSTPDTLDPFTTPPTTIPSTTPDTASATTPTMTTAADFTTTPTRTTISTSVASSADPTTATVVTETSETPSTAVPPMTNSNLALIAGLSVAGVLVLALIVGVIVSRSGGAAAAASAKAAEAAATSPVGGQTNQRPFSSSVQTTQGPYSASTYVTNSYPTYGYTFG